MELSADFWKFIDENIDIDANTLRLKYANKNSELLNMAITQIDCRQRARFKLASWIRNKYFIFPSTLSFEQSTSELLAYFHASLIPNYSVVLDMTCGLGIDAMTIAQKVKSVKAIELNELTAVFAVHNAKVCNINNIEIINSDSIEYLKKSKDYFDVIFVDPARRDIRNKRTFAFEDCMPDIVSNFDLISQHTSQLIIKSSPMLDITRIAKQFPFISDIWILSIKNECKEIVVKIDFINKPTKYVIHPLNFNSDETYMMLDIHSDRVLSNIDFVDGIDMESKYQWIYEPNSSFMKTFAWDFLCAKFPKLKKLSNNTHLFISSELYEQFPGRVLKILEFANLKELKKFKGEKLNIVIRNAPITIPDVKKQYKLQDGSNRFLYIGSYGNKNRIIAIVAERSDC